MTGSSTMSKPLCGLIHVFSTNQVQIMLVEPGMLLISNSVDKMTWVTERLIDFLYNYINHYDPQRRNQFLINVSRVLKHCEKMKVGKRKIGDIFNHSRLSQDVQVLLKKLYKAEESMLESAQQRSQQSALNELSSKPMSGTIQPSPEIEPYRDEEEDIELEEPVAFSSDDNSPHAAPDESNRPYEIDVFDTLEPKDGVEEERKADSSSSLSSDSSSDKSSSGSSDEEKKSLVEVPGRLRQVLGGVKEEVFKIKKHGLKDFLTVITV